LNDALETIDSEVVVFSDANVMYDTQALRKLARSFDDPRVGGVSGKVILVNGHLSYGKSEGRYYDLEHYIQRMEGRTGALIGADGAMYAIRRRLFKPLPTDCILDDLVIPMEITRQGFWLVHEPESTRVREEHAGGWRGVAEEGENHCRRGTVSCFRNRPCRVPHSLSCGSSTFRTRCCAGLWVLLPLALLLLVFFLHFSMESTDPIITGAFYSAVLITLSRIVRTTVSNFEKTAAC
jgi:hypothetical protein